MVSLSGFVVPPFSLRDKVIRGFTHPTAASYQSPDPSLSLLGHLDLLRDLLQKGNQRRIREPFVPRCRRCFP